METKLRNAAYTHAQLYEPTPDFPGIDMDAIYKKLTKESTGRYVAKARDKLLTQVKEEKKVTVKKRRSKIARFVDLVDAKDEELIDYALARMNNQFESQARHVASGAQTRALCARLAARYFYLMEHWKDGN